MCCYQKAPTSVLYMLSLPVILLLLHCIHNVAAIKCYVCDSSVNQSCENLKSNTTLVAEECTLDKMRTTDTWLFELNRFAYFDTGIRDGPLMNCQKVVARDPHNGKMVTARFCQLDTADSDACQILGNKLGWPAELARDANKGNDDKDRKSAIKRKGMNGRHGNNGGADGEQDLELHCSICNSDGCNGSENLQQWKSWSASFIPLLIAFISRLRHRAW